MKTVEVNFDGLVGPTHNYAGLAIGNIASQTNMNVIANPKEAALQGLKKMQLLMQLGIPQAVLPPQRRPNISLLRNLGFQGNDLQIIQDVFKVAPEIFRVAFSASSMWTANAATISPSADSQDGRVHITPANLISHLHRASEFEFTYKLFKTIFSNENHFVIHKPLFPHLNFSDEGAANHIRLCSDYGNPGLQMFVYGREALQKKQQTLPFTYPARQTLEASTAISRLHQLSTKQLMFAKQNPQAIDKGVFHNDVIAVSNQNVFLYHEHAFENIETVIKEIRNKFGNAIHLIAITEQMLSLDEAVQTYLLNSQIVTLPNGKMAIIAPEECLKNDTAYQVLQIILAADNPIQKLEFVNCRQSMQNGGGPACLRLRVVLTEQELAACHSGVFLNEMLYQQLVAWVEKFYRDKIAIDDLLDPKLLEESNTALDELAKILKLNSF